MRIYNKNGAVVFENGAFMQTFPKNTALIDFVDDGYIISAPYGIRSFVRTGEVRNEAGDLVPDPVDHITKILYSESGNGGVIGSFSSGFSSGFEV